MRKREFKQLCSAIAHFCEDGMGFNDGMDILNSLRNQHIKERRKTVQRVRPHNTGSPKLLDEMERFAIMCDRAGNGKDARCVRSWVKQLRAGA